MKDISHFFLFLFLECGDAYNTSYAFTKYTMEQN